VAEELRHSFELDRPFGATFNPPWTSLTVAQGQPCRKSNSTTRTPPIDFGIQADLVRPIPFYHHPLLLAQCRYRMHGIQYLLHCHRQNILRTLRTVGVMDQILHGNGAILIWTPNGVDHRWRLGRVYMVVLRVGKV
jgi:hypothetical protein